MAVKYEGAGKGKELGQNPAASLWLVCVIRSTFILIYLSVLWVSFYHSSSLAPLFPQRLSFMGNVFITEQ